MLVDVQGKPLRRTPRLVAGLAAERELERLECSRRMGGSAARRNRATGGGGAKFSPKSIAGLTLWLRADLGVTNAAGKASAWADQSATASSFTQGTAGNQPVINASGINGKQTLTFTAASSTSMATATTIHSYLTAGAWTAFTVAKYTGATITQVSSWTNPRILIDTGLLWGLVASTTMSAAYNWDGADKSARPTYTGGTAYYQTAQLTGGNVTNAVGAGGTTSTASGNLTTLTGTGSMGGAWDGEIGEIILYNRALSAGEISQVINGEIKPFWGL